MNESELKANIKASIKTAKATAADLILKIGDEKDPQKKAEMMKTLCELITAANDAVMRR